MNREEVIRFCKKIDEERALLADDMIMGKAKDFGAYQYACGIARGWLLAKDLLITALEQAEANDE